MQALRLVSIYCIKRLCQFVTLSTKESGGGAQILPDRRDWTTIMSAAGVPARAWARKHLFSPQKTLFPNPAAAPQPEAILKTKFRTAGPLAQQRSSAAAAFLLMDSANDFCHVDLCQSSAFSSLLVLSCFLRAILHVLTPYLSLCQSGTLFLIGHVYKHKTTEQVVVSLGNRKWCGVGLPLTMSKIDGEARLVKKQ